MIRVNGSSARSASAWVAARTVSFAARLLATLAVLGAAGAGCGGRPDTWSQPVDSPLTTFGLQDAVAIIDRPADRVVLLTTAPEQRLATTEVPVGRNVLNAAALSDGSKLFVVSAGPPAPLGDTQH